MKKHIIFMAMILYAISGWGQLPTATVGLGDFAIKSSTWEQTEPSIALDKTRHGNILVSFNTGYSHCGCWSFYNFQGFYFSNNGGHSWGGGDFIPNSAQSGGDPSTAFDAEGTGYMMGMNHDQSGFFTLITTDDAANWSTTTNNFHVTPTGSFDKEMAMTIDESNSSFANNYYVAYTDDDSGNVITSLRSLDQGVTFIDDVKISENSGRGANIQTGPNGEVYICWADFGSPASFPAQNIGFAFSSIGGALSGGSSSYNLLLIPYSPIGEYITAGDPSYGNTRVNGFPSMAVDKSCVTGRRGRIYIVTADINVISVGDTQSVINLRFSDHQGASGSWNGPIQISQSNLTHCWFPWISVDDITGVASVVYYGYDESGISNTKTFVAFSDPNDPTVSTWGNIPVSSVARTPDPLPSPPFAGNYEGDYLGIASYNDTAYAVWTDSRSGGPRQIFIARVDYNASKLASADVNTALECNSTNPTTITTESFEAADNIQIANCGGAVSIGSTSIPAVVSTTAGQSIIIGQGFVTAPGSVFTAEIRSLTPCQTPGVPSFSHLPPHAPSSDNTMTSTSINGIKVYAYPNPATDLITVGAFNNNYQNASFTVTDMSGRVMAQYNNPSVSVGDVRQVIDVASYAAGIYIVTMTADNQRYSFKFAKE